MLMWKISGTTLLYRAQDSVAQRADDDIHLLTYPQDKTTYQDFEQLASDELNSEQHG